MCSICVYDRTVGSLIDYLIKNWLKISLISDTEETVEKAWIIPDYLNKMD